MLARDIDEVLAAAAADLETLRGRSIYMTGGTGFIGATMLEIIVAANARLGLGARVVALSRDPQKFAERLPHLAAAPGITLVQGDVRVAAVEGRYDIVIAGAADASAQLNRDNPLGMIDTIVEGTRRTLELARDSGAKRMLLMSSGAVYGRFPPGVSLIEETATSAPDCLDPYYAYAEAKRMAELLCALSAARDGIEIPVARIFTLVGPLLPLDAHFAIGNFLRDALNGGPVRVGGDGTAVRSYLHSVDLCVWMFALLARGCSGRAYNVGSDQAVSIKTLAETVAAAAPRPCGVTIAGRADASNPINHYAPDILRARSELGLKVTIPLDEAISRTMAWHLGQRA
ncbi:dTDP-glucose 4,6-dehydratase [Rhodoblastus acidophilus]|uniref:NAD-dependent epimerase/dehydratase family protein n=1 Tax=Rhodoblastus acidophilus TaxID=1074 RepID=UPI00222446EA|nr:NAD(P)-dependent oxidoreductase [Rhodoblastus acidophilus]MCW2286053.1 dTDP-glucose 4,6-dehydratase [Rhodoblastus acidophilus]MCW2334947.1 dTDP-glucose 4,6-dehydratase [Rhodoblastus acidophilus]